MIPKSLLLGFLAVQAPHMTPATSPTDVAVFSNEAHVPAYEVLPVDKPAADIMSDDKFSRADWNRFDPGPWNENTKLNGVLKSISVVGVSWVYSRKNSFANCPVPPGHQDKLFGGQATTATHIRLEFADEHSRDVVVYALYTRGGFAKAADTTVSLWSGGQALKPFTQHLKSGWTPVRIPQSVDTLEIVVSNPETGSNLLLSQVSYN